MARQVVTIPVHLRRNMLFNWRIEWRGVDNGETISGNSSWVVNAKPRWVGALQFAMRKNMVGQWQGIIAQMQGRRGLISVDMCNPVAQPSLAYRENGIPWSNGEYFTTGSGFEYSPVMHAVEAVCAGATVIKVSTAYFPPVAGQIASYDSKPFQITYVLDIGSNQYECGVQRLVTAIPDGADIRCIARGLFEFSDEAQGAVEYGASGFSAPTLSLQEVLSYG